MAVKVREKVTADGKKFQKMLEDLDKLEVRIGIQQGAGSDNGVDLVDIATVSYTHLTLPTTSRV